MKRIGVLHAESLLGRELIERLSAILPDAELHLLTRDPAETGTLTQAGDAAALLELADADSLARLDVLVVAEQSGEDVVALADALPPGGSLLLVSPSRALAGPAPLVAGVNDALAGGQRVVHSPSAVTVGLALLLHPLLEMDPRQVTVTAIQPVSERDQAGLDELVEQTRSLLTFQSPLPQETLGAQLAFNLLAVSDAAPGNVADQLAGVLGRPLSIDLTELRAGVFHGIAMTVTCRFAAPVALDAVRERLASAPHVSLAPPGEIPPGAIAAAVHEDALVAVLGAGHHDDTVRFWVVVDHLVRGGAANAVGLLASSLGDRAALTH